METVIMHPKNNEQLHALKAFAKALKVEFEISKSPYNADFLAKIKESRQQVDEGKFTTLDPTKSVWENIK